LHDLIPIEWPEFVRPAAPARPWLSQASRAPRESVTPLGIMASWEIARSRLAPSPRAAAGLRYFVCLRTIDPRKNHLLLLHLWRRLAESKQSSPGLYIVGSRGWENENTVDMLERTSFPDGIVVEMASSNDQQVHQLLAGARAAVSNHRRRLWSAGN